MSNSQNSQPSIFGRILRFLGCLILIILVIAAGGMGMFAPPTGVGLIIACSIGKISMMKVTAPLIPFLIVLFVGLFVLILFPPITTIVPKFCGF